MESEQNPYTEQESSFDNLKKVTPLSKYLAMVLFVALPFIGGWIGYTLVPEKEMGWHSLNNSTEDSHDASLGSQNTLSDSQTFEGEKLFTSDSQNISFTIPDGWNSIDPSSLSTSLPGDFNTPLLAFKKADSGCVLAYTSYGEGGIGGAEGLISTSHGDIVYSVDWTFGSDWYVHNQHLDEPISFSYDGRQYLEKEFRYSNLSERLPNGFVLYDKDGKAVSETCNTDFNKLLETVGYYYKTIDLNESSKGSLWFTKERSKDRSGGRRVIFTPIDSRKNFEVMLLNASTQDTVFVLDSKLYFIGYDTKDFSRAIAYVDVFSGEKGIIQDTEIVDGRITSLYINGGYLYYIAGKEEEGLVQCLDTYGECNTTLYKISIGGGEAETLIENTSFTHIIGFNEDEEALYLSRKWGDAGCFSSSFAKYVGGREKFVGEYGGCYGDEGYDEAENNVSLIKEKAGYNDEKIEVARVHNGKISPQEIIPDQISEDRMKGTFTFISPD